jgi:hypothetical protein
VTAVLNVVLLSLAGLSILAALFFILKALGARSSINRQAYSVGQVEAKRASQVHWVRAGLFFLVGLIFLAIFAVRPLFSRATAPQATPTLPAVEVAPTTAVTLEAPPVEQASPAPSPTTLPPSPSPAATTELTATPSITTATVSSGVGVWLRGAPSTSGEQLEWLLDGTLVTLLGQQQTADDLLWEQVRTDAGVEGWVASDFLSINAPAAP